jgi:uncharacterized damage-inducible protein DinB
MNPMSEKDILLKSWEREIQTTLKLIKNYPLSRQDYKPHEKSRSAKELIWTFVIEEKLGISGASTGKMDFASMPGPPSSMKEVISELERVHKDFMNKIKNVPESELNQMMKFPSGPKKMMDIRRLDVLWSILMDHIHHRGQFSVYLRLVSAKVPSIYGPSADEPWE